jgi:peptidoglycan/xylan/chitin deacetylase (PgdA/CDA1 family)
MNPRRAWHRSRGRRALAQLLDQQPVTVLLLHSVGRPAAADFLPAGLDVAADEFAQLLRWLRQHAHVVSLTEAATSKNLRRAVALTFDDGYRDNYAVAWPLLREHNFPSALFVATAAVGAAELLPIHADYYLRHRDRNFPAPADTRDTPAHRQFVANYCREHRIELPKQGGDLYLTWEQLAEMSAGGWEIGAHTVTHPWLSAWPAADQRREILESRQVLEHRLGRPVRAFAYPYGYPDALDAGTEQWVAAQFDHAWLSVPGSPASAHALPRYSINRFVGRP